MTTDRFTPEELEELIQAHRDYLEAIAADTPEKRRKLRERIEREQREREPKDADS